MFCCIIMLVMNCCIIIWLAAIYYYMAGFIGICIWAGFSNGFVLLAGGINAYGAVAYGLVFAYGLGGANPNRSVSFGVSSGSSMSNPKTSTFFAGSYVTPLSRSNSFFAGGGGFSGCAPTVCRGGDNFGGSSRLGGVGEGFRGLGGSYFFTGIY